MEGIHIYVSSLAGNSNSYSVGSVEKPPTNDYIQFPALSDDDRPSFIIKFVLVRLGLIEIYTIQAKEAQLLRCSR